MPSEASEPCVIERHDYLPFGEECTTGPCASNPGMGGGQPRKFTGKERDAETGLDYFGARYYGSKIGRFTTTDPAQTIAPNLIDPQRWNKYAYARNNPLRYLDPDGRCAAPAGVGGGVGFCVEAFISSPGIGPFGDVLGPGAGDNRSFSATDGSLSYRARVQFVVDPASGEVSNFDARAGTSTAFAGTLSGAGSIHANITDKKRTEEGDTTFTLSILALNGLAGAPTAPKDPIDINLNFVVTSQGKVGLGPGSSQTDTRRWVRTAIRMEAGRPRRSMNDKKASRRTSALPRSSSPSASRSDRPADRWPWQQW